MKKSDILALASALIGAVLLYAPYTWFKILGVLLFFGGLVEPIVEKALEERREVEATRVREQVTQQVEAVVEEALPKSLRVTQEGLRVWEAPPAKDIFFISYFGREAQPKVDREAAETYCKYLKALDRLGEVRRRFWHDPSEITWRRTVISSIFSSWYSEEVFEQAMQELFTKAKRRLEYGYVPSGEPSRKVKKTPFLERSEVKRWVELGEQISSRPSEQKDLVECLLSPREDPFGRSTFGRLKYPVVD